ncbi:type I polyketide synthase [Amycolatopsis sp. NPDC051903]|uniref:type I polyketide synthase n=1 Tax=Amycolatopsis sp. NPDC051903 TaxID=3363936 RepID=UPI0037AC4BD3
MSDADKLRDYLKRATEELLQTRRQLSEVESASREPLAIVGMACRFPGEVNSPDDLWDVVVSGRDAIGGFPTDRGWDLAALRNGGSATQLGGFVYDATQFDAAFFGISPREALAMDPQQRILLETAWEALERAGIPTGSLKETRTGVFVGGTTRSYLEEKTAKAPGLEGYRLTGGTASVMSGRISYLLGLEGPSVTVDTASSSSLVALHLAAQSLRLGESDLALVGGVTVMSTPDVFVEFTRHGGLAEDGRCKSFAEAADGTGWAEGVGMIAVERLSTAQELGHRVLAVVRGSAVNQDGASNGLTAPSGPSQQRLIRDALARSGVSPLEIDAVEAHGTGTRLGDPIEAQALLATLGQGREKGRPLWIGSVKSNIGHTEVASGVAGVIKMVEAMRYGVLPKTLHVDRPSTHVDWSVGDVRLLTEQIPWPETGRPRRAGVSGFGISGTNAHVVLEQAPDGAEPAATPDDGAPKPVLVSARSAQALRDQADRLAAWVERRPELTVADLAWSSATTRSSFEHRAVVVATDRAEVLSGLRALADDVADPAVFSNETRGLGRLAVVFSGQGAQRAGMGRELSARFPVFAEALDEVCALLDPVLAGEKPLRDVMFAEAETPDAGLLDQTGYTQPALFAWQTAWLRLLRSWGIRPDFVMGHSIGEISAAHAAGVFSLEDACTLVAARANLMQALPEGGAMLAVAAEEAEITSLLADVDGIGIAAVNAPHSVVLSGDEDAVVDLGRVLSDQEYKTTRLRVSHAFHSARMNPMLGGFRAAIAGISFQEPAVPLVSNLTGELAGAEVATVDYWVRHVREPVRFADGVSTLDRQGAAVFVEGGPSSALSAMIHTTLDAEAATVIPAVRKDQDEAAGAITALAHLHTAGAELDWPAVFAGMGAQARRVPLPTYAFQHERFWPGVVVPAGDVGAAGLDVVDHPLLGAGVSLPGVESQVFSGRVSVDTHPWLADHAANGVVILPGTAFVELVGHAGAALGCARIGDLTLHEPLVLPEHDGIDLQVLVGSPERDGDRPVLVHSRTAADQPWTRHASATVTAAPAEAVVGWADQAWPPADAVAVALDGFYEQTGVAGESAFDYGPVFQGLQTVWTRGDEVFAEVALPPSAREQVGRFGLHPALLDAALQASVFAPLAPVEHGRMPFSFAGVAVRAAGATTLRVRLTVTGPDTVSVEAVDPVGTPVATLTSLVLRPITADRLTDAAPGTLLRLEWLETQPASGAPSATWVTLDADLGELPAEPGDVVHGLDELVGAGVPDVVLVPVQGRGEDVAEAVETASTAVLDLLRSWLARPELEAAKLVFLTSNAAGTGLVTDLAAAAVWGLVRSAQTEHPDRFVLVDHDGAPMSTLADTALAEPQLAMREDRVTVPRLVPASTPETTTDSWGRGTVVITGGTGGLGAALARHLVTERGARRLLLISRRGPEAPGAAELRTELTELGADVTIAACDIADRAALAAVLADHPVAAVVQTAGVLADATITSLTPEAVKRVLEPKVRGTWNLHELTREAGLSAFVVFSSMAGLLGAAGQGNYAAANSFLDALASHRRAHGQPAVSLAWGAWSQQTGMTSELSEADIQRMARAGFPPMSIEQGLALFDQAMAAREPVLAATRLDRSAVSAPSSRVLDALVTRAPVRAAAKATAGTSLGQRLSAMPPAERLRRLTELVRAEVAAVLGHATPDEVQPTQVLKELGLDSLASIELRNRLNELTGLRLPPTIAFDNPTAALLSESLLADLVADPAATVEQTPVLAPRDDDPVVLVGMGCRYPGGVTSPEDLWDLVASGRDVIGGFPTDRGWDLGALRDGDSDTLVGGFLYEAAEFDAGFFGISPREALAMDPQQRLLLETTWEALERAGIDPRTLKGSRTGVFVGASHYGYLDEKSSLRDELEAHLLTGSTSSVMSGRIAYTLGLEGPAVTIDTACSSSLVALHLATQSLRSGECDLAVVGGVSVMSQPRVFVGLSRQKVLSVDGRCKAFAETADGTGFAEGVGVLAVERLSTARERGHRVLAVVRGSAMNQDGASNGLTAPNGASQRRVITDALTRSGVLPTEIDAVEAHGTGTRLGDPIEAHALIETVGQGRENGHPVWIGSVKSNIGHAQAAAGAAGIIKMVQAIRHRVLPRTLHVDEPTTHVDWDAGAVRVLTEQIPWPETGRPRRAGVSGFGISGTNAHIILEQAPPQDEPAAAAAADGPVPIVVSGQSAPAVREQAARLVELVERDTDLALADVAWSLATTRSAFDHRAAVVAADRDEALSGLRALAAGEPGPAVVTGEVTGAGGLVFVFPGQGSQWAGMGRELMETSAVFRESIEDCQNALAPWISWSLTDVLTDPAGADLLERLDVVQPVLWAMNLSLAKVWRSYGVEPDAVIGHSQGEIAAACFAGALSLEDGARVIALRSQVLSAMVGDGGVVLVSLPADDVRERLVDGLAIAGINGPTSVGVAGDTETLKRFMADCEADGIRARWVPASIATHCERVAPYREQLLQLLAPVTPRTGDVRFFSTVRADWLDGAELDAEYWYQNALRPVLFEPAVRTLLAEGHHAFAEVSAHPVTTVPLGETAEAAGSGAVVTGTLRRGQGSAHRLLTSLATLQTAGVAVDWPAVFSGGRKVDLPTYAFQHQRYWPEITAEPATVHPGSEVDAEFWAAVNGGDTTRLAAELSLEESSLAPLLPALSSWRRRQEDRATLAGAGYEVTWTSVAPPASAGAPAPWWVFVPAGYDDQPVIAGLRRQLTDAGAAVTTTEVRAEDVDREALAARITALGEAPAGVVSFLAWHDEAADADSHVPIGLKLTALLVQALGDAAVAAPAWCVTRGAVAVDDSREVSRPAQAAVWGWGRTAAVEHAQRWGGLIDVPETADPDAVAGQVAAVLVSGGGQEDQLAVRPSGTWARRLAHRAIDPVPDPTWEMPAEGSVLVTGGTGALGAQTARWLAEGGVPHLVLVSREGSLAPGARELEAELGAFGARVTFVAGDAADREAMAKTIAAIPAEYPLAGVVHTAAVLQGGTIDGVTGEELATVFRPKVDAAMVLHELTQGLNLAMFVMVSSVIGTVGGVGLGSYAAANAYLDGLAQYRRAHGLPATAIACDGRGEGATRRSLRTFDLIGISPAMAVEGMRRVLERGDATAVIADVDWKQFLAIFTAARPSALLGDLPEVNRSAEQVDAGLAVDPAVRLRTRLAALAHADRIRTVLDLVRVQLAAVLGYTDSAPIPENRAFRDLGFDSLTAVELRNILSMATGLDLPRTLVFDYPTPTDLAQHLLDELLGEEGRPGNSVLLGKVAALESELRSVEVAASERALIADRLQQLLSEWRSEEPESGAALDEATDDQLFELMGKEFGIS